MSGIEATDGGVEDGLGGGEEGVESRQSEMVAFCCLPLSLFNRRGEAESPAQHKLAPVRLASAGWMMDILEATQDDGRQASSWFLRSTTMEYMYHSFQSSPVVTELQYLRSEQGGFSLY
jgi:hypothetical protein